MSKGECLPRFGYRCSMKHDMLDACSPSTSELFSLGDTEVSMRFFAFAVLTLSIPSLDAQSSGRQIPVYIIYTEAAREFWANNPDCLPTCNLSALLTRAMSDLNRFAEN